MNAPAKTAVILVTRAATTIGRAKALAAAVEADQVLAVGPDDEAGALLLAGLQGEGIAAERVAAETSDCERPDRCSGGLP